MQANNTPADQPQEIDVNMGSAVERVDAWVDGFIKLLPNIGVALVVLGITIAVAVMVRRFVEKRAHAKDRDNLGSMLGGFAKWLIIIVGAMLALTIVAPTVKPGDLIAGLGVSSVAIGFAFKDILQNWLAGLLILLRQPFEIGDQIEVGDYEGTVEKIETRATLIKTYDGQRAVIPNSDIYTDAVLVKTAHDMRRSQYDIGIGYADDMDKAAETLLEAVQSVEGVLSDPAPEVLPWDLAASWVTLRARWWTDSPRADVVHVHARVIKAVKQALDQASIDMPYDTVVNLFHDQTEEVDGDRSRQREGWPEPADGSSIRPRWKAEREAAESRDGDRNEERETEARTG